MTDVFDVALPKWPAMVVVGEPVTVAQAQEIIVRTDGWYVGTNDKAWQKAVYQRAGIKFKEEPHYLQVDFDDLERFNKEVGGLQLGYLNTSRIATAYIGGPHGWCDWTGRIGETGHNIGKWPSVGEVLDEWSRIAEAFPYLRLWSQLYSGEQCEDDIRPLVEFVVAEGRAIAQAPTDRGEPRPTDRDLASEMARLFMPGRERGCSLKVLGDAIDYVRSLRCASATPGDDNG